MKKFLLSTLVSFASFTGAYASNEIVNTVVSEEIEATGLQASEVQRTVDLEKLEADFNCFTTIKVRDKEGSETNIHFSTKTESAIDCMEKGKGYANLYEAAGYEILSYKNSFGVE